MYNEIMLICSLFACFFPNTSNDEVANYYEELHVQPSSSQQEIRKAYFKLAQVKHPDRNSHANAHQQFINLGKAYNILKDPQKRRIHDSRLNRNKIEIICCSLCQGN